MYKISQKNTWMHRNSKCRYNYEKLGKYELDRKVAFVEKGLEYGGNPGVILG